jgi:hypothetical protein
MFQLYSHYQTYLQSLVELYMLNAYVMWDPSRKAQFFLPRYWDPTYRTHLTYIVQQVIVDRPDDGGMVETCSLVLLTYKHVAVLESIPLYQ